MPYKKIIPLLAIVTGLFWARMACADDAAAPKVANKPEVLGKFIRVLRSDDGQPIAMQTSISRYVPKDPKLDGVVVDLVSAVHVGEGAYYAALNKLFKDFDAVLFELVAPEGTRIPKGGGE